MGLRFLKIAVVYLMVGVVLGLVMGIRGNFALAPVHAHLNLLGWASLALVGLIYHLYPAAGTTKLARVHFWMHNLTLPVLMGALALLLSGYEAVDPVVAIGSVVMVVALFVFAVNVFVNVKATTP
ncbi:MAG: cytochrome-c oxidase [Betaproteobacteria bacterium]